MIITKISYNREDFAVYNNTVLSTRNSLLRIAPRAVNALTNRDVLSFSFHYYVCSY